MKRCLTTRTNKQHTKTTTKTKTSLGYIKRSCLERQTTRDPSGSWVCPRRPGAHLPWLCLVETPPAPRHQKMSDLNHFIPMLTRSSPLVDSLSSRGSPGAWIVTDLSPRLPSRLLERCRSRRSLQQESRETGTNRSRGDQGSFRRSQLPPLHLNIHHLSTSPISLHGWSHTHLCFRELREWPDL